MGSSIQRRTLFLANPKYICSCLHATKQPTQQNPSIEIDAPQARGIFAARMTTPVPSDVQKTSKPTNASTTPSHDLPNTAPVRSMSTANPSGSGSLSHRSSFAENMRSHPPSPRSQRHPSFTQAAVQELLNHPTPKHVADNRFSGRDWRQIHVGELVSEEDVRFVESTTGVEEATKASNSQTRNWTGLMRSTVID